VQRGLWVHGVDTRLDYLRACVAFRLSDQVGAIRCLTLVTAGDDPVAAFAVRLYDPLGRPQSLPIGASQVASEKWVIPPSPRRVML
jgi:hypothetical protein